MMIGHININFDPAASCAGGDAVSVEGGGLGGHLYMEYLCVCCGCFCVLFECVVSCHCLFS